MDEYLYNLTVTNPLREPVIRAAIQTLELPPGSHGLDAGCGVGFQACLLAGSAGELRRVTALDLAPEIVAYAHKYVAEAGLGDRISFKVGDVNELPFEDNSFDWAWSMDCVSYLPQDPLPALRELARVVRPNGRVAILAWSSQNLLPGYPLLEAHLNATSAGLAPFVQGREPDLHFLRALGRLQEVGFERPSSRTFAGSVHAPLTKEIRAGLEALLLMRWPGNEAELPAGEVELFQRLCRPESADFILDRPDYSAFFTYTMFSGFVPE